MSISIKPKIFWLGFLLIVFSTCCNEKSLIKQAREEGTTSAYNKYLSRYKDGKYSFEARQEIHDIYFTRRRDSVFTIFLEKLLNRSEPYTGMISIQPANQLLMGTIPSISISQLPPNEEVILHAYRRFWDGVLYSFASYKADNNGELFLKKDFAYDGTYTGIDSLGIFWSMSWPSTNKLDLPFLVDTLEMNDIHLFLEMKNKIVSWESIELMDKLPGIVSKHINNDTLVGGFHYPETQDNIPAIVLLSGSEGGYENTDKMAKIMASYGYGVLSLAYFNIDPLPAHLERIPLEYFYSAIDWLKHQSNIDKSRIIVTGGSRGGELALLIASKRPDVKGVIAVEPSCVLWQGLPHNPGSVFFPKPAWTEGGKPLPFLKHRLHLPTMIKFGSGASQIELMNLYEGKLDKKRKIRSAFIEVEKIQGPILLIAGKDGKIWPACEMCQMIEKRLSDKEFQFPVRVRYYNNAGHYVTITPDWSPTIGYKYEQLKVGGTDSGNAAAQLLSWNEILHFLNYYFPSQGIATAEY